MNAACMVRGGVHAFGCLEAASLRIVMAVDTTVAASINFLCFSSIDYLIH